MAVTVYNFLLWKIFIAILVCVTHHFYFVSADSKTHQLDGERPQTYIHDFNEKINQYKQAREHLEGFSRPHTQIQDLVFKQNISDLSNDKPLNKHASSERRYILTMMKIMSFLEQSSHRGGSSKCVLDSLRLFTHFVRGYPWAFQFFDASGKPGPALTQGWVKLHGNYDQCKAAVAPPSSKDSRDGFEGNYCVMSYYLQPGPAKEGMNSFSAELGGCFPSSCTPAEITGFVRGAFGYANYSSSKVGATKCIEGKTKITKATVFAIIFVVVMGSLVIAGTLYDFLFEQGIQVVCCSPLHGTGNDLDVDDRCILDEDRYSSLVKSEDDAKMTRRCKLGQILLAFSLYTNGKKVLTVSDTSGTLGAIHGIRFLSMCWVVLGHCYVFTLQSVMNPMMFLDLIHRRTFDVISNALVSVDTFFTMSGLLLAYLTFNEFKRKGLNINWPMFYFHRIWRLTPPYVFVVVFFLGFQQYFGDGPMWSNEQPDDKENCDDHWWANFLYVNNLVYATKPCFAHTWYLANDMQFFVISPIMLVAFYFHRLAGVCSCVVVLLVSWVTSGVLSAYNDWGVSVLDPRMIKTHWFDHYYITPWCRIGPYVLGILAGYLLSATNGKPFQMRWWVVVLGWVTSIGVGLAVVYGVHGGVDGADPPSRGAAALYNAVARSAWSACICWVIIACSAGYGGPINSLLSWSPFVVLGRLTYMTYLIHLSLIKIFFGNLGMPYYLNDVIMAIFYLGLLSFCYLAAFFFMLLCESPTVALEKAIFGRK